MSVRAAPSPSSESGSRAPRKPVSPSSSPHINRAQIQRLAEFRFQLRRFLHFSNLAAEEAGLRPQQYQLLQSIHGMPDELEPTIANIATRMMLRHNSAVELVDRTIEQGYLQRRTDATDHRRVLLRLTTEGERVLASLAEYHLRELEQAGPELIRLLRRVVNMNAAGDASARRPAELPNR